MARSFSRSSSNLPLALLIISSLVFAPFAEAGPRGGSIDPAPSVEGAAVPGLTVDQLSDCSATIWGEYGSSARSGNRSTRGSGLGQVVDRFVRPFS